MPASRMVGLLAAIVVLAVFPAAAGAATRPIFELFTPEPSAGGKAEVHIFSPSARNCRLTFRGAGPQQTFRAPRGRAHMQWRFRVSRGAAGGSWTAVAKCRSKGRVLRVSEPLYLSTTGTGPLVRSGSMRASASRRSPVFRSPGRNGAGGLGAAGNPFPAGQCTFHAYEKRPDIFTRATQPPYRIPWNQWDAWQWTGNAQRAGFPTGTRAAPGAIAVWPRTATMRVGHVAYVEGVNPNGAYLISERNYNWNPNITRRWVQPGGGVTFIYGGPSGNPSAGTPPRPARNPHGHLDGANRTSPGRLRLVGWAADEDAPSTVLTVRALVDGQVVGEATAGVGRADVGAHGFDFDVPVDSRAHTISIVAVNVGGGLDAVIGGTTTIPAVASGVFGDLDGDGYVGCADIAILRSNYGKSGPGLAGDLNVDGIVNILDLSAMLSNVNKPPGEGDCPP